MPARLKACLMIDCIFWRIGWFTAWNSTFIRLPSFARTPSAPLFHPAASRIEFALSTLNSHRVFGDAHGGRFMKFPVASA